MCIAEDSRVEVQTLELRWGETASSLQIWDTHCTFLDPVQSRIRWVGEFLIQSNPNPPGLDWIMNPADWSSPFHTASSVLPHSNLARPPLRTSHCVCVCGGEYFQLSTQLVIAIFLVGKPLQEKLRIRYPPAPTCYRRTCHIAQISIKHYARLQIT